MPLVLKSPLHILLLCVMLCAVIVGLAVVEPAMAASARSGFPLMSKSSLEEVLKTEGKGKVVMVTIFASWCGPCRKEIPQLVHLRNKVAESEMLILGISADDNIIKLKKFTLDTKVNFPVFLGTPDLFEGYEVSSIPQMLVFDSKGRLIENFSGLLSDEAFNNLVEYLLGYAYE